MDSQRWKAPLLAGVAAIVVAAVFHSSYEPGVIGDDAYYYLGALSLAESGEYRDLTHPDAPPQRHFLPGYSLLLSPLILLAGDSLVAPRMLSVLLLALGSIGIWRLNAVWLRAGWAAVAVGWLLLQPLTAFFSSAILSEVPYLTLSVGLLLLFCGLEDRDRASPAPKRTRFQTGIWLGFGLAGAFALFWLRPIGIALLVGLMLSALQRRDWRGLGLYGVASVVLIAVFFVWSRGAEGDGDRTLYASELGNYFAIMGDARSGLAAVLQKVQLYAVEGTGLFASWNALAGFGSVGVVLGFALAAVASIALVHGSRVALRGSAALVVHYVIAYAVILLVWPTASARYLWPLAPALFLLALLGVSDWTAKRSRATPLAVAWIALSLTACSLDLLALHRGDRTVVGSDLPLESLAWFRSAPDESRMLAAELPAQATLYTRRPSVALYNYDRPDRLMKALREGGATHVLLRSDQDVMLSVGGSSGAVARAERTATLRLLGDSPLWREVYANEAERSRVFRSQGDTGRFLEAYSLFESGQRAFEQGRVVEARAQLERALAADPRLCFARFTLASILDSAGERDRALQLLRTAREHWPNDALTRFQYGRALVQRGELAAGRVELRTARALAVETAVLSQDAFVLKSITGAALEGPRGMQDR